MTSLKAKNINGILFHISFFSRFYPSYYCFDDFYLRPSQYILFHVDNNTLHMEFSPWCIFLPSLFEKLSICSKFTFHLSRIKMDSKKCFRLIRNDRVDFVVIKLRLLLLKSTESSVNLFTYFFTLPCR